MASWAIGIFIYLFLAALFYALLTGTARPEPRVRERDELDESPQED